MNKSTTSYATQKIGVFTMFYKSTNYGGVLQAYALCRVLNKLGYDAEQVMLENSYEIISTRRRLIDYFNFYKIIKKIQIILNNLYKKNRSKKFNEQWGVRQKSFEAFYDTVPHCNQVYTSKNVEECIDYYDIFVTGSDQVWNIGGKRIPYTLYFVPPEKTRISYAACLGQTQLDEESKKIFSEELDKYKAISVREKDAIELLKPLTSVPVEWTLDPVLLLDKEEWDEVATIKRIESKYLLCYFLGDDKRLRMLAKQYARRHNLKIVTFPHFPLEYHKNDSSFGDIEIYDASPYDFISLVKYAECVFTDSFHASVFSLIYEKLFFVFARKGEERMKSRIYTLVELFDASSYFCDGDDKFNIEYLEKNRLANPPTKTREFRDMREKSISFLTKI